MRDSTSIDATDATGTEAGKPGAVSAQTPAAPKRPTPTFERTPRDIVIGAALVLAGGMLWGINATVSKILMGTYHADPLWIACVRQLAAGMIFLVCSAVFTPRKLIGVCRDWRVWPKLVACAMACVLLVQVAYLNAIDWTNSGTATVLQTLNLLFVLLFVCVRGSRLPRVRESVGVALAFAGTVLIATGGDLSRLSLPLPGLAWGLIDALCTAVMSIAPIAMMAKWGNFTVNGMMFIVSGVLLVPFVRPWASAPALDGLGIALMTFTVVGGTFGAYWLFLAGTQRCGAMRATMLGTSEPVTATISGVLFAGAVFTPTDLAGFAMIILMVFLMR
ncbi:DMT family transporter [Bifidobacterium scaligerum]|uniref:EamA family transporter n=1 Tax=Bifidobacterium scaligerum TaxID=2052656 RepID=A0A2M9HN57_9BIFI|nr:EamA family transporter [Bifidobacterium scaligerum]PJM78235.1 EamA family transporter [Bifidobacterium scaligerum]